MPFFDLQVNGYAGADFNGDRMTDEQLQQACQRLRTDGVAGILATVITDELPAMCRRLARLAAARRQDPGVAELIRGFHIEGPFLNPQRGFIGAHPPHAACPADRDKMEQLMEAAGGATRLVTLAPECDPGLRVTRWLADQGIVVAAGHCNPTLDQLKAAIDQGLTMFTHLGNGCPLELHRHDNIIQRALHYASRLWIGWIADGVHVPLFALSNYLRTAGIERSFVVTDAISAAGLGPGEFQLGGQTVFVDQQLATWSLDRSHLVGSASTMPQSVANLRQHLGLDDPQIRRLTWDNPRQAIGIDHDRNDEQ
jgi:N-acetylglucosamine-6-phosphate deacetylase